MSMLKVLQCLDGGGSGTGCSYYTQVMKCPRCARLDGENPEETGTEQTKHLDAGKVFHKLAEIYHSGEMEPGTTMEYDDANLIPAISEGMRVFDAYRQEFGVEAFGEVLGCEVQLPRTVGEATGITAEPVLDDMVSATDVKAITEMMGVDEFTCRIDMVVKVDEAKATELNEDFGIDIKPGVYLLDFKTKGAEPKMLDYVERNETQPNAYMMAYAAVYKIKPDGMLFVNVIKHKDMHQAGKERKYRSFSVVAVDYPDETIETSVRTMLHNAVVLAKTDMPNRAACFTYSANYIRICRHMLSGACDRC